MRRRIQLQLAIRRACYPVVLPLQSTNLPSSYFLHVALEQVPRVEVGHSLDRSSERWREESPGISLIPICRVEDASQLPDVTAKQSRRHYQKNNMHCSNSA
jgi:hypothetical protein